MVGCESVAGRKADFCSPVVDLESVRSVVEATHRYKEIFYTD